MRWARAGSWGVVAAIAFLFFAGGARAAGKGRDGKASESKAQAVRDYLDKATAAFALNRYAVAAENYEKAFELKPDPAVLYNAAQAYRLAGNKERALELYQSYLRMYGAEKRAEVEKHIENLKQAIEKDHAVATSPPTTPAPVGTTHDAPPPAPEPATPAPKAETPPAAAQLERPAPAAPAPVPTPAPAEPTPVLVTPASPPANEGSIVTKPWFWIVVGGAVVAAAVGGFLLFRKGPSDPTGSLGSLDGN
jgi:hypothetical protein